MTKHQGKPNSQVRITLPDTLAEALTATPDELPQKVVEAVAAQFYRIEKITHAQVADILKLDRWQTDAFLQEAQAHRPLERAEFADDLAMLRKIGS
jgi:hypothetical protein